MYWYPKTIFSQTYHMTLEHRSEKKAVNFEYNHEFSAGLHWYGIHLRVKYGLVYIRT